VKKNFLNQKNGGNFGTNDVKMKNKYQNQNTETKVEEPMVAYANPLNIIDTARKGIKISNALDLVNKLGLSQLEFANILHVSLRTVQRFESSKLLDSDGSSKIIQLQNINTKGVNVFGSQSSFNQWIRTPLLSLNNKTPLQYFDTPFGFQLIEQLLGRIEHGIFA
jgi:putative toxin-antitoxin system antitoxin component (TIGR02293 family)